MNTVYITVMPMGAFGNSLKRELGKNTGKFISNVVFGDKHSTPYRRVDARRQAASEARIAEYEARRRVAEVKNEAKLEEARLRREEARERAELDRKNQLYAIDGAVLKNIDTLNSAPIPSDKAGLLRMLSELSVQLKAYKWEKGTDESEIRNKYTDALLEKYTQCVQELEFMDATDPHLKHYMKIAKKAKRSRFLKKNGSWLYPLIVISVILFVAFVMAVISLMPDIFFLIVVFLAEYHSQIAWLFAICIFGYVGYRIFRKTKSNNLEKKVIVQNEVQESVPLKENQPINEMVEDNSVFFDLNENSRIEKRLSSIWNKYRRLIRNEFMNRKPIFSADGVVNSVLFVGVNPSYNPVDDEVLISSADNSALMYGSFYQRDDAPNYFKSLEEFASMVGKGYTHINLLYAREDDRDILLRTNSDFIREQLELSYDTIVKIAPVAIFFFSDYCKDMIFGADRWVDPSTEKDGHYILRGTNIPIFFTDDITIIDDTSKMALIRRLKSII